MERRRIVIYHKADYDGIFCREIARHFLGDTAEYIGWDYGEPEPIVPADAELWIMDLSVPGLMNHPNLCWIDHHGTAITQYGSREGFQLVGVSACRLAWQWFCGNKPTMEEFRERSVSEPWAVRLAGEYDVWDKRDESAERLQYGLDSIGTPDWKEMFKALGSLDGDWYVGHLIERGEAAQAVIEKRNADTVRERSFTAIFEGLNFLCLNTARCNSLTFAAAVKPEHDGLMGFVWDGKSWRVSLYGVPHQPLVDLAAIAVKYGGGGHKQACGFRAEAGSRVVPWPCDWVVPF